MHNDFVFDQTIARATGACLAIVVDIADLLPTNRVRFMAWQLNQASEQKNCQADGHRTIGQMGPCHLHYDDDDVDDGGGDDMFFFGPLTLLMLWLHNINHYGHAHFHCVCMIRALENSMIPCKTWVYVQ